MRKQTQLLSKSNGILLIKFDFRDSQIKKYSVTSYGVGVSRAHSQKLLRGCLKSHNWFVGSSGLGPWQSTEMRAFLNEFVERNCPVIPVLLGNTPQQPKLPIFLRGHTWVDFRTDTEAMENLIWGITGKPPERKPKPQTVIQDDDLSSEKGINYTRLRDLLAAGKWKEANEENFAVMLKASSREKEGWFDAESINNFPCTDLRTIDQLWVKYSKGRFGFSVQKKIYLECGGKADGDYYEEAWEKFCDRVGWKVKENWIGESDVAFNTSAPEGHLPVVGSVGEFSRRLHGWGTFWWASGSGSVGYFFSRMKTCEL